jgi:hypothetical protein
LQINPFVGLQGALFRHAFTFGIFGVKKMCPSNPQKIKVFAEEILLARSKLGRDRKVRVVCERVMKQNGKPRCDMI